MHQDIRPFPCTICEQTFRQKAHLQRHEATHGIDSTANRKRRKRPLMDDMNELNRRTESDDELYRPFGEKRKMTIGTMKNEEDEEEEEEDEMDVDPMIEPIDGSQVTMFSMLVFSVKIHAVTDSFPLLLNNWLLLVRLRRSCCVR